MSASPLLDPNQLRVIEAVHRGFLYQHLWAVGCLLLSSRNRTSEVHVERDEDIELILGESRIYVQIKTKSERFAPGDLEGVLTRFARLKQRDEADGAIASSRFLLVLNQPLGPTLQAQLREGPLSGFVVVLHPGNELPEGWSELPPAWRDIEEAMGWCSSRAAEVPYRLLRPDTMVLKLATSVLFASAGAGVEDHVFRLEDTRELFEQLLEGLQSFPEAPSPYRPQINEPALASHARVRIIAGHSGAGKTAWASESATHTSIRTVYFNATGLAGEGLVNDLARELATRLIPATGIPLQEVLLPGTGGGLNSLRRLAQYFRDAGISATVVLDDAHTVEPVTIRTLIDLLPPINFVFLGHPGDPLRNLEAILGVRSETLRGWDFHTIALEAVSRDCSITPESSRRLQELSGGLPLFVRGALMSAWADYGGDVAAFCASIDRLVHARETDQERILTRTFSALDDDSRGLLSVLSLSDQPLSRIEACLWVSSCLSLTEAGFHRHLRTFAAMGILQQFPNQKFKVHDAMRIVGRQHLEALDEGLRRSAWEGLRQMLLESMAPAMPTGRSSLLGRAYEMLGDFEGLVGLIDQEIIHERGVAPQIAAAIKSSLTNGNHPSRDKFWAYNGLVLCASRYGPQEEVPDLLRQMEVLIDTGELGDDEQLALIHKEAEYHAEHGNRDVALRGVSRMAAVLEADDGAHERSAFFRAVRYSMVKTLRSLGRRREALQMAGPLATEYMQALGTDPEFLRNAEPRTISALIEAAAMDQSEVYHCANSFDLLGILMKEGGEVAIVPHHCALRLFIHIGATDSVARSGADFVEHLMDLRQFDEALEALEDLVLPALDEPNMARHYSDLVGFHAVILAYCGRFDDADRRIGTLEPYEASMEPSERTRVSHQRQIIADLRAGRAPS